MNHIDESVLQQMADGRIPSDAEVERHLAGCAVCRSGLETYRFMAAAIAESPETPSDLHLADRVMSRIQSWEERRTYWKEWMWVWIGGFSGLIATVIFTLIPASGMQFETLAEWGVIVREKVSIVMEQAVVLVGGHFQLLILALVIVLAFEWFDKRLIRRIHPGMK